MSRDRPLELTVNDQPVESAAPEERILLDFLREDLELVGTKRGCDLGTCG